MTTVNEIINCTPHAIVLNDGRTFPVSGNVARVSMAPSFVGVIDGILTYRNEAGPITGLPAPVEGNIFIVSAMVLDANSRCLRPRTDLVAPSTGNSSTVRNEAGHIVSVEGFVIVGEFVA